jgi:hypothetical protein
MMPGVPQFSPAGGQQGMPSQPMMPGVPQFSGQPGSGFMPPQVPGVAGVAGAFQNMNIRGVYNVLIQGQPQGINLMAGPPAIEAFDAESIMPDVISVVLCLC